EAELLSGTKNPNVKSKILTDYIRGNPRNPGIQGNCRQGRCQRVKRNVRGGTQVEGAPLSKIQKMQIPHFSGKWWKIVENATLR
ncbi:hypothetical protein RhiirA1_484181, partial [Rhizophagus irregularis]